MNELSVCWHHIARVLSSFLLEDFLLIIHNIMEFLHWKLTKRDQGWLSLNGYYYLDPSFGSLKREKKVLQYFGFITESK